MASIARDVGRSSTNRSSDITHFLPRLLKKTLNTNDYIIKLSRVSSPDSQ